MKFLPGKNFKRMPFDLDLPEGVKKSIRYWAKTQAQIDASPDKPDKLRPGDLLENVRVTGYVVRASRKETLILIPEPGGGYAYLLVPR